MALKILDKSSIEIKSNNEIGPGRQYSFQLDLEKIRVIAITTRIDFDDELLYLTFLDNDGELYHVNSFYFDESLLELLKIKYDIDYNSINIVEEWYDNERSTIFFPAEMSRNELYKSGYKGLNTIFDFFLRKLRVRHPANGILREEIKRYLIK